jgi:hypothetical protein
MQSLQCDLTAARDRGGDPGHDPRLRRANPPGPEPGDEWLLGGGWNLGLFPDANPHKRLLDEITARPVYLGGADGHSGWANSEALRRAGISADTDDPPLGVIERDADGEPTGTLREEAQALMRRVLPPVTDADRREGALAGLAMANAFGITSLVDASVSRAELDTYRALERDGRLTARVVGSVRMAGYGDPEIPPCSSPTAAAAADWCVPMPPRSFSTACWKGKPQPCSSRTSTPRAAARAAPAC